MPKRFRFVLRPGWLVFHLVVLVLAVTMVLLGRWQLDVSDSKHFDLQNFGYAIQWWLFTAFALAMWLRLIRDAARKTVPGADGPGSAEGVRAEPEQVPYRRYVPPVQQEAVVDPVRAAYNEYLASLAAQDAAREDSR